MVPVLPLIFGPNITGSFALGAQNASDLLGYWVAQTAFINVTATSAGAYVGKGATTGCPALNRGGIRLNASNSSSLYSDSVSTVQPSANQALMIIKA